MSQSTAPRHEGGARLILPLNVIANVLQALRYATQQRQACLPRLLCCSVRRSASPEKSGQGIFCLCSLCLDILQVALLHRTDFSAERQSQRLEVLLTCCTFSNNKALSMLCGACAHHRIYRFCHLPLLLFPDLALIRRFLERPHALGIIVLQELAEPY